MSHSTIVSTATLAEHLEDPDWRIIDCRFDLLHPEAGEEAWQQGHIPGALHAHLERDLSGPVTATSGRHPLPDPETLARTFGLWGIGPDTQVVCYDAQGGATAARLWWLLRWLGHPAVAVLDGGIEKWTDEHRPLSTEVPPDPAPVVFHPRPDAALAVDTRQLCERLDDDGVCLLDVRDEERFLGEREPIDPVAGHIPGARNLPYRKNLDASDCLLPPEALRKMYGRILGSGDASHCIVMCGSGVTACQTLLALEHAGLHGARLYPGSWSEWISDPSRPVEIGAAD